LDLDFSQGLFASNPYLGVYFVRMDQQDKYANSNTLLIVQTKFVPKLGIASCFLYLFSSTLLLHEVWRLGELLKGKRA
jgi:hypothetical protein